MVHAFGKERSDRILYYVGEPNKIIRVLELPSWPNLNFQALNIFKMLSVTGN